MTARSTAPTLETRSDGVNDWRATDRTLPWPTSGSVISRDGTTIGYGQIGRGPGLVVLHGTMSSAYNHRELAQALAVNFTVYVPDRRGRGLSGQFGPGYGLRSEVEDLDALLVATGARQVFGVSSGGIIALEAVLALPNAQRIAVFEPPLFPDTRWPIRILRNFDSLMTQGRLARALVMAMKEAQMGPAFFRAMPVWLTERLTGMMLAQEDRKGSGDYVSMRELASTLHYDFQLVVEASERIDHFKGIDAEVHLLGGSRSPAYLKRALSTLETLVPRSTRIELSGLDHAASWNANRGGRPGPVASAIRQVLSGDGARH
jgi:pimeloyl-ACP methyl ester carboxylesterase